MMRIISKTLVKFGFIDNLPSSGLPLAVHREPVCLSINLGGKLLRLSVRHGTALCALMLIRPRRRHRYD